MAIVPLRKLEVTRPGYVDVTGLAMPPLGGKCWLLEAKGQFLLERTAGTLRTIACTHAGSGTLLLYDGIPDDAGLFPDEGKDIPNANGRLLFKANPAVMGSWMLDAGFQHGLTVRATGGQPGTPALASIVWVPFKKAQPRAA